MDGMLTSTAPYVGHEYARSIKSQVLVAMKLEGRRTVRSGDSVTLPGEAAVIGKVTSGSFAPSLGYAVALAYVDKEYADRDTFALTAGRSSLIAGKTNAVLQERHCAHKVLIRPSDVFDVFYDSGAFCF